MTHIIKINCRKTRIALLASLWIISSFLASYSAYLNYLTSQSYDAQNDCHFNYVLNHQFCKSECDKNSHVYDPDYGCPPATKEVFIMTEYGMSGFTIMIQIGAFFIMNYWRSWFELQCTSHEQQTNVS